MSISDTDTNERPTARADLQQCKINARATITLQEHAADLLCQMRGACWNTCTRTQQGRQVHACCGNLPHAAICGTPLGAVEQIAAAPSPALSNAAAPNAAETSAADLSAVDPSAVDTSAAESRVTQATLGTGDAIAGTAAGTNAAAGTGSNCGSLAAMYIVRAKRFERQTKTHTAMARAWSIQLYMQRASNLAFARHLRQTRPPGVAGATHPCPEVSRSGADAAAVRAAREACDARVREWAIVLKKAILLKTQLSIARVCGEHLAFAQIAHREDPSCAGDYWSRFLLLGGDMFLEACKAMRKGARREPDVACGVSRASASGDRMRAGGAHVAPRKRPRCENPGVPTPSWA